MLIVNADVFPVPQGMIGIGFAENRPDAQDWGRALSAEVSGGIKLRDELGDDPAQSAVLAEVAALRSRLDVLESRLDEGASV